LAAAGIASVAALFVNPFGWRLVAYPFEFASKQKLNVAHIEEWVSVDFHDPFGTFVMILLAALLGAALLRERRWRLADLLLLFLALYSGMTYIRFLFFLAIIAAPILAKLLDFIPGYEPEIDKPFLNAILMAITAAFLISYFPPPAPAALETSLAERYPVEILPYLREHPPAGRLLNLHLWGGFLIWHERNLKIFVDSRVDIYEYAGVFSDYLDLIGIQKPQEILDKYKIRYVLFPNNDKLSYVLDHDSRWKTDYRDELSVLFERVGPVPE
jgi:hypothetical protein